MRYDAVIIGAGVTGSAVARELSRRQGRLLVVERAGDVCEGTSKANSAIVHAGFDAEPGSKKAEMNVLGNEKMTQLAQELDIPFKRVGAFVVCLNEEDMPKLQGLYDRGIANGVKGLSILTGEEARKREPNLSDKVCAALFAGTSGIICPFELTLGMAESAAKNGASTPTGAILRLPPSSTPPGSTPTPSTTRPATASCTSPPARASTACWTKPPAPT